MNRILRTYSGIQNLPRGTAPRTITPGALVLEGGAWRGLYSEGVMDAMMQEGINFQTVLGISAGSMSSLAYLSGQIGKSARFNLAHRFDPDYMGLGAMKADHGVTGFTYFFNYFSDNEDIDWARFYEPSRRLLIGASCLEDGRLVYFEKGKDSIKKAVQASASVPYVTEPVQIGGKHYLDGGCCVKIPYAWPVRHGYEKIVVIRTRDRAYRKDPEKEPVCLNHLLYGRYPKFCAALDSSGRRYNALLDQIDADEARGRTFVIAPEKPVDISRFERDVDKIGALYWDGYDDMKKLMPKLKAYLEK